MTRIKTTTRRGREVVGHRRQAHVADVGRQLLIHHRLVVEAGRVDEAQVGPRPGTELAARHERRHDRELHRRAHVQVAVLTALERELVDHVEVLVRVHDRARAHGKIDDLVLRLAARALVEVERPVAVEGEEAVEVDEEVVDDLDARGAVVVLLARVRQAVGRERLAPSKAPLAMRVP